MEDKRHELSFGYTTDFIWGAYPSDFAYESDSGSAEIVPGSSHV
jgi:hypothetical protein